MSVNGEHRGIMENTVDKRCCVAPKNIITSSEKLHKAWKKANLTQCQFLGSSQEGTIEHDSNYYCLLHLPTEAVDKNTRREDILQFATDQIQQGQSKFDFICIQSSELKISHNTNSDVTFIGAKIDQTTIKFTNHQPKSVDFDYCEFTGQRNNKIIGTPEQIFIQNSNVSGKLEITASTDYLRINHNHFSSETGIQFDTTSYGLIISIDTSKGIPSIDIYNNEFHTPLEIINTKISTLKIVDNKFFVCPIFSKSKFNDITNLTLPSLDDYCLEEIPKKCGENDNIWRDQYEKFREIYNVTKKQEKYLEQSDYFTLMQICFRKITKRSKLLRTISYLYHELSDYGQSITRPLGWLLVLLIFSFTIFITLGLSYEHSAYLMLNQIRPYTLMYPDTYGDFLKCPESIHCKTLIDYPRGWLLFLWSILSSICYIFILACIGLALRWNFRKA